MTLTEEQTEVVEIDAGRHLVLAPPGSGKTEMLSQRIVRALRHGVDPARMLCATFTNRAAYEMRARVTAEADGLALPDVGNLHHFCERFLRRVGILHPGKRVIDEIEQRDLAHEVFDVLREELREGKSADLRRTHGVTVLAHIPNGAPDLLVKMHEDLESYIARCAKNRVDPASGALEGMAVLHQTAIGLPRKLILPWPENANALYAMGALVPMEKAYRALKRRFLGVDFDDLLNETYLRLVRKPLPEEARYLWVQVDEVQDLNPLQWAIVNELTAQHGVSVYFGDIEQAIFSFMGASLERLRESTSTCELHAFRTNFRATPLLLEILMRFSLEQLLSDRPFISVPVDPLGADGEVKFQLVETSQTIREEVDRLLRTGTAREVAILVRSNADADAFEAEVAPLGWRQVKVSGLELGHYRPMRDFFAFVDLFAGQPSRIAWIALVRRFGAGIFSLREARYFVRELFAAGWDPEALLRAAEPVSRFLPRGGRANLWAWRNRRVLLSLHQVLRPAFATARRRVETGGSFEALFDVFAAIALGKTVRYSVQELLPGNEARDWNSCGISYEEACRRACEAMGKFVRYAEHVLSKDERSFAAFLREEWSTLRRLKEADMLVGDERIVISTVHKAKGRQFDAVVVPSCDAYCGEPREEDELARQFYVAMSRAKRHLLVFGWEKDLPRGIAPCFKQGYVGYYLRQARGEDLSQDWLFAWERLAALDLARRYEAASVRHGLSCAWQSVVRMALKVLCHHPDAEARRAALLSALEYDPMAPARSVVIACLRRTRVFDDKVVTAVRSCCLASRSERVWFEGLAYFQAAPESRLVRSCLEDGLYAPLGAVRLRTAEVLDERFGTAWGRVVFGTTGDYRRLGEVGHPGHEETIRRILEINNLPSGVRKGLRDVLFRRARCV